MKKVVRIYCEVFGPVIKKILEEKFDVIIDNKNPDFVFCGPYLLGSNANNPYKYKNAIKIFITGEAVSPDWNVYDYAVGFDELTYGDRYLRCPYWALSLDDEKLKQLVNRKKFTKKDLANKKKFCNFIYSNRNGHEMRKKIFDEISKYKHVDSWGRWLNNMGQFAGNKIDVIKGYKFSIASENAEYLGYTTEKLVDAYLGESLPIYWGNKNVGSEFNIKAMINANDYKNLDDMVAKIKELDNDDEKYLKIMNEPIFNINPFIHRKNFEKFLIDIVSQEKIKAVRVGYGMFPDRYERMYNESWEATHLQRDFWKWVFSAKSNKSVMFLMICGIKIDISNLVFSMQKFLQYGFNIRFKRFHTQIRLFGIDFVNKFHG